MSSEHSNKFGRPVWSILAVTKILQAGDKWNG
jgi:hypothetical protein